MQNLKNIGRIEDLLRNNKTFESVGNMLLFWELCQRVNTALKQGDNYVISHYHYYAKSMTFCRWKNEHTPKDAKRITFYGQKYYVYE